MKILHVHSDKKFITALRAYENPDFENTLVFLGEPFENNINAKFYPNTIASFRTIAHMAKNYDLVVFFSLRLQHSVICNMLPPNIKVAWRFFGAELYPYLHKDVLTKRSMGYYQTDTLHHILSVIKNNLLYGASAEKLFWNAVRRCNFFFGLADTEYEYLQSHFRCLPPFCSVPFETSDFPTIQYNKEPIIMIGHSGDIYVNHLDVFESIKTLSCRENYQYYTFLSYGKYSDKYKNAIIHYTKDFSTLHVVTKFIPLTEYRHLQEKSTALVINSIRQIAMGNIFSAFRRGVKVYVHSNNIMLPWMRKHGFLVFTTDQFKQDLIDGNITLLPEEMDANVEAYRHLGELFSIENFQKSLLNFVKSEK